MINVAVSVKENTKSFSIDNLSLYDLEMKLILSVLDGFDGNRTHTAKALGIGIRTLQRKIKKYELLKQNTTENTNSL